MSKTLLYASTAFLGFAMFLPPPAFAADDGNDRSVNERIEQLEADLALLKRQKEVDDEKAKSAAEKAALVEFGRKGLKISSPDKKYELSLKGYAQLDHREFLDDNNESNRGEFLVRRARPTLEVKAGDASLRIMPDFAGSTTRVFDAYVDYKLFNELQFRVGKFKPPVGLERLQSATDTFFIERGHPTNLVPTRDIGAQVYGNLFDERLEYQLGIFNGTPDLGNTDSDVDDKKDIVARVFTTPLRNSDIVALQGLGFGISGSTGEREGSTTNTLLGDYRTPGQQAFFRYRTGGTATFADGSHWRVSPQAYWYYTNFGLLAEYVQSNQEVTRSGSTEELEHSAWQIAGSYVITGEDVNFRGGIKPNEDFDIESGGWGAFEAVARVGETDIDDDAFPVFADPSASASKAQSFGAGVNWYLNENVKLQLNYDHTTFDGGASGDQDRPDEEALISRVQFRF